MGAVKIKASDSWFSKCVRERAGYKCERCGAQHERSSCGLHCSHFHGRGKWSVRHDPENCESLCYGCHAYLGANPAEHKERILQALGQYRFDALQERANDTKRGRIVKKEERLLSKHYREQLKIMLSVRDNGENGRIEFVGYL